MLSDLIFRIQDSKVARVALGVLAAFAVAGLALVAAKTLRGDDGAEGIDGVIVRQNSSGQVVITNRDELPFELSFPLPQNCEETKAALRSIMAEHDSQAAASDEAASDFAVLHRIGEDLCAYREYLEFMQTETNSWYGIGEGEESAAGDASEDAETSDSDAG